MLLKLCVIIVAMVIRMSIRTYTELSQLTTYEERFRYLRLQGVVGKETFGYDRYINQVLYNSYKWRAARDKVIFRDNGCDLGIEGHGIYGRIIIHHMNPITLEDIEKERSHIFDPEFLICTSHSTHNAIHYGDENLLIKAPIERRPNDTCPWRK